MPRLAELTGPWDGLVVLCAANSYDGTHMADWHLAEHLSRLAPVLYVDPPMSRLTPVRRPEARATLRGPRLRVVRPRLARLTPVVQPFPSRSVTAGLTSALTRGYLRRATARLGGTVRGVISGWPLYPIFGSCGERARVYWAKDDFVAGAALLGLNPGLLDARERRVADSADLVVAASPVVAGTWCARGSRSVLIPFGADVDGYRGVDDAPLPPDAGLASPVAGFVGRINSRTDLRLLEAVAGRGRSLLLVGPKDPGFEPRRFGALLRNPNVRWVGPKPPGALPGYLRVIDVGLVPYRDSPFNRGSFPLKMLEYLAAGRAVVATGLPAARWLDTGLIAIADEPEDFAGQVDRLLVPSRDPLLAAERRSFAARHSWACRAAEMLAAIADVTPPAAGHRQP